LIPGPGTLASADRARSPAPPRGSPCPAGWAPRSPGRPNSAGTRGGLYSGLGCPPEGIGMGQGGGSPGSAPRLGPPFSLARSWTGEPAAKLGVADDPPRGGPVLGALCGVPGPSQELCGVAYSLSPPGREPGVEIKWCSGERRLPWGVPDRLRRSSLRSSLVISPATDGTRLLFGTAVEGPATPALALSASTRRLCCAQYVLNSALVKPLAPYVFLHRVWNCS